MTPQRKPKKQQVIYVVWDTDPKYDEPVLAFKTQSDATHEAIKRNRENTTYADEAAGNMSKIFKVRRFTR